MDTDTDSDMQEPADHLSDSSSSNSLHTIEDNDAEDFFDYIDPCTVSPLMRAVLKEDVGEVKAMLGAGYHVNANDNQGRTALHLAVGKQNLDIIQLLLSQEAININARDHTGRTSLSVALRYRAGADIVEKLLNHGSDVHLTDSSGNGSFHDAVSSCHNPGSCCGEEIIQLLTMYGADINGKNSGHQAPLGLALRSNDEELISRLLYHKADPHFYYIDHAFSHFLRHNISKEELLRPYVDFRNIQFLQGCSIPTLQKLWKYQIKSVFAAWCFSHTDPLIVIRAIFSISESEVTYGEGVNDYCDLKDDCSIKDLYLFVNELYEAEELHDLMYDPQTALFLLDQLPYCMFSTDTCDKELAVLLKLLISNDNYLPACALLWLLNELPTVLPAATVACFEDLNPNVVYNGETDDDLYESLLTTECALWKMYLLPEFTINHEKTCSPLCYEALSQFYNSGCLISNSTPTSLLELSRNKIRHLCNSKQNFDPAKPFAYASRIRSLGLPHKLENILLLRTPLYSVSGYERTEPPALKDY